MSKLRSLLVSTMRLYDYAGERAVIEEVQEYEGTGEYWYQLASESGESFPYYWTDSMLARREA